MVIDVERHQFTIDEYHRMAEVGLLREDDRVELIDGEIVDMSPIGRRHWVRVSVIGRLFTERLGRAVLVSVQNPLTLPGRSQPEPDVTLLRPRPDDYEGKDATAEDALLVIEVADTSLDYDRRVKAPLYARNGIVEYWLVNLNENHVVVFRNPTPDGYLDVRVVRAGDELRPLSFPDLAVAVADILG